MNMSNVPVDELRRRGGDEAELVLDPRIQESIGRSLKAHYDDIVNTPVPDKFLVLLAQLEAQEMRAKTGNVS